MKRDWDTVRGVLLAVEALGDTHSHLESSSLPHVDAEAFAYHVALAVDAGLLQGKCLRSMDDAPVCAVSGLTWEGHELLDKIRSPGVWNKIKATARAKGLSLSVEVIKIGATEVIKSLMGG